MTNEKRGKAVAMRLTPEEQARLKQVFAECRIAFRLDYFEATYGVTRQQAMETLQPKTP